MKERKINHYARYRTTLANERTLLSYIRTSLALFAAGVTFIRFFGVMVLVWIGYIFVILSVLLSIFGIVSFFREKKHINAIQN